MNTLVEQADQIWSAVQQKVTNSIRSDGLLGSIKEFVPRRRLRSGQQTNPAIYVLSRQISTVEWGANRGIGELTVSFGITHATLRPEEVSPQLEALLSALVELLMDFPAIGGADDIRVLTVNPDDAPFGPEDTLPWATVTVVWPFQFIQPEGVR